MGQMALGCGLSPELLWDQPPLNWLLKRRQTKLMICNWTLWCISFTWVFCANTWQGISHVRAILWNNGRWRKSHFAPVGRWCPSLHRVSPIPTDMEPTNRVPCKACNGVCLLSTESLSREGPRPSMCRSLQVTVSWLEVRATGPMCLVCSLAQGACPISPISSQFFSGRPNCPWLE